MVFNYRIRDGWPSLESERVVLVFHGLKPKEQQLFHFQGDQAAVQVAGEGASSVSVTCANERAKVVFHSHYAEGTNTLRFGSQAVRFANAGGLLLAGDRTVDLSQGRKIIHLKGERVTVESMGP